MAQRIIRSVLLFVLGTIVFGSALWFSLPHAGVATPALAQRLPDHGAAAEAAPVKEERTVYLGGELSSEDLLSFTTAIQAGSPRSVLLLDSIKTTKYTRAFFESYLPERVQPIGAFAPAIANLEARYKLKPEAALSWARNPPPNVWKKLFPRADQVVVCPAEPRELLLQAASLAGTLQAPLFLHGGQEADTAELKHWLRFWHTRQVYLAGNVPGMTAKPVDLSVIHVRDAEAVAESNVRALAKAGPITTFVVSNPADVSVGKGSMSLLAPWIAAQRHAALLLTNAAGDNVEAIVRAALDNRHLHNVDAVILAGSLQAIPTKSRPNPIPGDKDVMIEMEPLTPVGSEPFSFAVGRLFNEDLSVVALQLARCRLLAETHGPRKALVASNPGGSLPLLEIFSRNTAKELRNAGYQMTTMFGQDVNKSDLRRFMPEHDIVLWEGHHNTLIKDWEMPDWDEPMLPALVFLQSCLALTEPKVQPLIYRGAVGVVGSSTRIYSGSGGAMSLAFFNALLYDHQSLGSSLRQAKNFLLAYSLLKEKRLGKDAVRTGANQRASWSFTLWGDPTIQLPRPEKPTDALPAVQHEVKGNTLTIKLPAQSHDKVTTSKYQVQMLPNGRLAGLIRKEKEEDGQPLVPFVFVEIHLPHAPAGQVPTLHGKLPSNLYVFCWDARRRSGYLLVTPRAKDENELRFHIDWEQESGVGSQGYIPVSEHRVNGH